MKAKEKENLLRQLGYLMRFANRINNNHPELANDTIRQSIEESKIIIRDNYNLNEPKIVQSEEIKLK